MSTYIYIYTDTYYRLYITNMIMNMYNWVYKPYHHRISSSASQLVVYLQDSAMPARFEPHQLPHAAPRLVAKPVLWATTLKSRMLPECALHAAPAVTRGSFTQKICQINSCPLCPLAGANFWTATLLHTFRIIHTSTNRTHRYSSPTTHKNWYAGGFNVS